MPAIIAPKARQLGVAQKAPMVEPLAICNDYFQLHAALRQRADDLDLTRAAMDEQAGWASGYAGRLLCNPTGKRPTTTASGNRQRTFRGLGPMSMGTILGVLGLRIALVEDEKRLPQG